MDHLEAAALAAAASAATTAVNPDIKINSLDSSHISGSFRDDVSLKESMVQSRSGSSSSVKMSTDLQQGLASIIGQNLRRGSSTVRHRSPHASQERYMPYSATSPRSPHSPLSPQASTSPFLVHSPPPPTSPSSTSNFLSAPPLSSSPSYASYNVLPSGSPFVQLGPARSPQHLQSTNRHEQQTSQQQQQQEQAAFGRYLHRHNSSEGVPASESWTGRSISSESSGRSPSSYPLSSHFPPSWSLTSRQESYHDHPNSHLDSKHLHLHRHEPNPRHHHHPASQYHSSTLSDRQEAEHGTRMSQDYPERIGSHREDETSRQHQQRQQHIRHSPQQHHRHQHQSQHSQHHTHSSRPQDRYQDPRSEHPVDQYFHTSNIPKASTSIHIHHSSPSSAAHNAFAPLSQPLRRSSRHLHSHGQEHHPQQQQQHLYTSHPSRHHSMTSEHAEHTSVSSHANTGEPSSLSRGPPYAVSRTSSSSRLPPHSSFSIVSSASVSGSNSVHAPSSTFAAGAGSAVRAVPAGSTTSPVAVTTTASGEIKTTRRRRRPNESYSTIIIKAIRNSPLQRLKLSEIYDYVSREIPTMDGNDKGWQNTVRHNLSHNKCFRRIVVKDEDLPGSADDDDGDSKPSNGGKSKQAKRGKGGCWVLVPENLEEHISSSRPKKSSTDQVQSPGVPGAGSGGLTSSTSPKSHGHHTVGSSGDAVIPKATTSSTGGAYLSAQLSKDCAPSHPHSTVMDIDCNVASMMIAEQQLQQSGRHHGPHMHPSHYTPPHPHSRQNSQCSSQSGHRHPHHQQQHHDASYPYLPPHYPSSSPSSSTMMMNQPRSSSAAYQSFTATTHPSQHNYNSSGDEWDHDSESDDGQSEHSVLSADRENDDDDEYEGDEAMDAKGEDDTVSHYSSSRPSPSRSPSASSLSVTSSPMEIEEADGGNGAVSFSSLPTTGRRRPGMSIQNMLN